MDLRTSGPRCAPSWASRSMRTTLAASGQESDETAANLSQSTKMPDFPLMSSALGLRPESMAEERRDLKLDESCGGAGNPCSNRCSCEAPVADRHFESHAAPALTSASAVRIHTPRPDMRQRSSSPGSAFSEEVTSASAARLSPPILPDSFEPRSRSSERGVKGALAFATLLFLALGLAPASSRCPKTSTEAERTLNVQGRGGEGG